MEAHLRPAVARILEELRARPKGTKKMMARRLLRAFGYERRSHENVREICAEFARAEIHVALTLTDPATLDEQVILRLDEQPRPAAAPPPDPPADARVPPPLPAPGQLARGKRCSIADVIAAVRMCTVQILTDVGGGSGIIVDPEGLILTSRHVVDAEDGLSERRVHVGFADGTHETGTVVRSHRTLDYALLVVPRRGLLAVPIGEPLRLREADTVYAIGNPGGLTHSVSRGIVSAARRTFTTNVEYIQTDAAINPGSSGGPVVTEQGDLVGISTWAYRGDEGAQAQGLNFAVPVDYVRDDIGMLRRIGLDAACHRPYCRHCGWLQTEESPHCGNCGDAFPPASDEGGKG